MRSITYSILFLALALSMENPGKAWAQKEIFLDSKCTRCHSLSAAGIEKKKAEGADEDEDTGGEKVEPPDLSHVGKYCDAAYIKDFITKKVDHKPHEGAEQTGKHKFKFKGSDEELDKLANWLASFK